MYSVAASGYGWKNITKLWQIPTLNLHLISLVLVSKIRCTLFKFMLSKIREAAWVPDKFIAKNVVSRVFEQVVGTQQTRRQTGGNCVLIRSVKSSDFAHESVAKRPPRRYASSIWSPHYKWLHLHLVWHRTNNSNRSAGRLISQNIVSVRTRAAETQLNATGKLANFDADPAIQWDWHSGTWLSYHKLSSSLDGVITSLARLLDTSLAHLLDTSLVRLLNTFVRTALSWPHEKTDSYTQHTIKDHIHTYIYVRHDSTSHVHHLSNTIKENLTLRRSGQTTDIHSVKCTHDTGLTPSAAADTSVEILTQCQWRTTVPWRNKDCSDRGQKCWQLASVGW